MVSSGIHRPCHHLHVGHRSMLGQAEIRHGQSQSPNHPVVRRMDHRDTRSKDVLGDCGLSDGKSKPRCLPLLASCNYSIVGLLIKLHCVQSSSLASSVALEVAGSISFLHIHVHLGRVFLSACNLGARVHSPLIISPSCLGYSCSDAMPFHRGSPATPICMPSRIIYSGLQQRGSPPAVERSGENAYVLSLLACIECA